MAAVFVKTLSTLEVRGELLAAGVEEQAQGDGDVKVNPQNVGLDCSAEAQGNFEIQEPFKEGAARQVRWAPDDCIDGSIEDIGAHTKLEGVPRAACLRCWFVVRFVMRAVVAAAGQGKEEEVESEEQCH